MTNNVVHILGIRAVAARMTPADWYRHGYLVECLDCDNDFELQQSDDGTWLPMIVHAWDCKGVARLAMERDSGSWRDREACNAETKRGLHRAFVHRLSRTATLTRSATMRRMPRGVLGRATDGFAVKAIETTYAGTVFRSRLEARWACFFDKLCWPWTYEPLDGRGYLPDFAIGGGAPLIVEVKPAAAAQDYSDALGKVALGLETRWHHDILVVGLSPIAASLESCCNLHPAAGLLGRGRSFTVGSWYRCPVCTGIVVAHRDGPFLGRPCGHAVDGAEVGAAAASAVVGLWASATNAVRWKPGNCRKPDS